MSDINRKRDYVADLYPHRGWKKKVSKMSDAQIVAIFLREHNKAHKAQSQDPPKEIPNDDPIPF